MFWQRRMAADPSIWRKVLHGRKRDVDAMSSEQIVEGMGMD
jgi:hypothetical protein